MIRVLGTRGVRAHRERTGKQVMVAFNITDETYAYWNDVRGLAASFRYMRDPVNREEVIKMVVDTTRSYCGNCCFNRFARGRAA